MTGGGIASLEMTGGMRPLGMMGGHAPLLGGLRSRTIFFMG